MSCAANSTDALRERVLEIIFVFSGGDINDIKRVDVNGRLMKGHVPKGPEWLFRSYLFDRPHNAKMSMKGENIMRIEYYIPYP